MNTLQGKEFQLHSTAIIWECAEGEGSFRWSGITEAFVIPIRSTADVPPAGLFPFQRWKTANYFRLKDKPSAE